MGLEGAMLALGATVGGINSIIKSRQQKKEQAAYDAQVQAATQQKAQTDNAIAQQAAQTQEAYQSVMKEQLKSITGALAEQNAITLRNQQAAQNANQMALIDIEQKRQQALATIPQTTGNPLALRGLGTTYTSPLGDTSTPTLKNRFLTGY